MVVEGLGAGGRSTGRSPEGDWTLTARPRGASPRRRTTGIQS
jgi:hypothetical protein